MGSSIKGRTAALMFVMPAFAMAFFLCDGQANPAMGHGKDGAPVVQITAPANNSTYSWKSLLNYSAVVSWQGESTQYQEIPSDQVLITTTYVPDLSKMTGQPAAAAKPIPAGLLEIMRSGCIGCHEFRAKAMGPSFAAIAARYPDTEANTNTLARYIHDGSTGVWGQAAMPAHPKFTQAQLDAIAHWIVKNAANPNVNYYVGTEGAIRMEAPTTPGPNAGMLLTASFTAPAASTDQGQAPHGEGAVILHGK